MPRTGRLIHTTTGDVLLSQVRWCDTFGCKLRGLMFRRELAEGEGLLMVEARASRSRATIHMLFMAFPIATVWMDNDFRVVDKVCAKPWWLVYAPAKAARYTLEAHPDLLERVEVGDVLAFEAADE